MHLQGARYLKMRKISPSPDSPTKDYKQRSETVFKEMNHVEAILGMDGLDREDPRLPRLLLQQARGSGLQVKTTPKGLWQWLKIAQSSGLTRPSTPGGGAPRYRQAARTVMPK